MQNENPELAGQYQTLFILWAALLMSQFIFLLLIFLIKPELFTLDLSKPFFGSNAAIVAILGLAAMAAVAISFVVRRKFVQKAADEQNVAHVQTGLIFGCALCEASSLFGLFLAFAFDHPYFFLWIILGILGMLLHMPKKSELASAGYKKVQ